MKLYYSPGACSLSVHIACKEAGIPLAIERVNLHSAERLTETGKSFWAINPKGYVPALELDDGQILTEAAAVLEYVADLKPEAKLAPPQGSLERSRMREWLLFLSTEFHKTMGPMFNPALSAEARKEIAGRLQGRYALFEKQLADGRSFLLGETLTVADCYAYVVGGYAYPLKIDISAFPKVVAYLKRIRERPMVKEAEAEEGGH
ncbi:MAG: glutathione S-transferase family protein [Methylobacteriaceae bacterium]|jgi:glutathione S-transferase|nr:glutathione S-transferase family protein [Methylobacteriaceae bacterium]